METEHYQVRLEILKGYELQLEGLKADFTKVNQQIDVEIDEANRERLKRKQYLIESEMKKLADNIDKIRGELKDPTKQTARPLSIQGDLISSLLNILSSYSDIDSSLESTYQSARPADWPRPIPPSLEGKLADLNDMKPDQNGYEPILKFVAYLVVDSDLPNPLSQELKQWAVQQAQNFDQLLAQIRQAAVQTQSGSYLMVVVDQKNTQGQQEKNRYFVKSWFILDSNNYNPRSGSGFHQLDIPGSLDTAEQTFSVKEIEALLGELLDQSRKECLRQKQLLKNESLTIEIFLPAELLNEAIDAWEVEDEFISVTIGITHLILIRSSERLRPDYFLRRGGDWKEKWGSMERLKKASVDSTCLSGDDVSPQTLVSELQKRDRIGLKLIQKPLSIGKNTPYGAIQYTGTPIALWLRKEFQALDASEETELKNILKSLLDRLPETIRETRRNSSTVGNHISLWWEDFNRLPPDLDYEIP